MTVLKALKETPEPHPVGMSHANTIGLPGIASIKRMISPRGWPYVPAPSRQSTITAGACCGSVSTV